MAGGMLSLQLLAALAVAVAQEWGSAAVVDQASPRQLTDSDMKMVILNGQSISNDGSGYFDGMPQYLTSVSGQLVAAEQWRLLSKIWSGNVYLSSGTSGMSGTCGASTCDAKVISSPAVPGQWQVGDVIMVHGSPPAASTSEEDAKSTNAMIMFIILIVFIVLGIVGCVVGVQYSIRNTKKDARKGLGSDEAAEGGRV